MTSVYINKFVAKWCLYCYHPEVHCHYHVGKNGTFIHPVRNLYSHAVSASLCTGRSGESLGKGKRYQTFLLYSAGDVTLGYTPEYTDDTFSLACVSMKKAAMHLCPNTYISSHSSY